MMPGMSSATTPFEPEEEIARVELVKRLFGTVEAPPRIGRFVPRRAPGGFGHDGAIGCWGWAARAGRTDGGPPPAQWREAYRRTWPEFR